MSLFRPGCNTEASQIYISRGDGNFTKVPIAVDRGYFFEPDRIQRPDIQVCHRLLMDVDGDGQLDFVQPESGTLENPITQAGRLRIYFRTGKKPDRIKGTRQRHRCQHDDRVRPRGSRCRWSRDLSVSERLQWPAGRRGLWLHALGRPGGGGTDEHHALFDGVRRLDSRCPPQGMAWVHQGGPDKRPHTGQGHEVL